MSRERTEKDAFETVSREGYFGSPDPITTSNKSEAPRIVLDGHFGEPTAAIGAESKKLEAASALPASLCGLGLDDSEVARGLEGCAGRYAGGRTVIVTGGGRGIGEGCIRVFFEAGANVVIADRDADSGGALAAELNARARSGQKALLVRTDVSVVADLSRLVSEAIEAFGRIDCIVNNAGWHPPHKSIDDFSVDEMQDLFQLNFISVFALCKLALPHLRKVRGNIINISSWVGAFGQSKATTYAATKGATTAFTKALAIDEAAHGVRVNSVSPGNIWTPLWKEGVDADADPTAAREAGERVQVLGRMGTILETGRLALCIAADLTFTTGVDHVQSGGAEIGYGLKATAAPAAKPVEAA